MNKGMFNSTLKYIANDNDNSNCLFDFIIRMDELKGMINNISIELGWPS